MTMTDTSNGSRVTPTNRVREQLLRWVNDTHAGEAVARWLGKTAVSLQLRWKMGTIGKIPWTPLSRPISEATIALVATGGVHLCSDKSFAIESDASFRVIPRTATAADLCITHQRYDRRDAARDINLIFPLERLLELETEGIVGRVADTHYSFGFTYNPADLLVPGRELGHRLAQARVDLALLVPA